MEPLRFHRSSSMLKFAVLPLLGAIYPVLFHYANNAHLVLLSSFIELCLLFAVAGFALYIFLIFFNRGSAVQSAVGALLILFFFHTYGLVFDWLHSMDMFRVETRNFMPFWVFAALYLAYLAKVSNAKISTEIYKLLMLMLGALMVFNLVKIIPAEIQKTKDIPVTNFPTAADGTFAAGQQYPDIYYLLFDEAAGFEVARQYWDYNQVDTFVTFLKENRFYIAEESHGGSMNTLREISARLNYKEYPVGPEYFEVYKDAIANNSVMAYLKTHGYTIIAFDERRDPYPTTPPLPADVLIEASPEQFASRFAPLDDYWILVLQNTMLRSLLDQDQDPDHLRHRDMILYTAENIVSQQISSPKFVYVHLILPHAPFVFSETGEITATTQTEYGNWQRYLDNYRFFLHIAQEMVEKITFATRGRAVIIVQSDHGARNSTHGKYTGTLQNYSENYKTWIVNALYLPNCNDAPLTQNMDPINTFPIVFNCYFDENIPIK